MKVYRFPQQAIRIQTLVIGRTNRDFDRRRAQRWPLRNRWLIVRARTRTTWREVWTDLRYVLRG